MKRFGLNSLHLTLSCCGREGRFFRVVVFTDMCAFPTDIHINSQSGV